MLKIQIKLKKILRDALSQNLLLSIQCFATCGSTLGADCTTKNNEKSPICLCLRDTTNFTNRANSNKLVLPGMVYSIFIIIIFGTKETHVLLCIRVSGFL